MRNLSLSIITTSLNRNILLTKTLESVLAQSYPAIEQIVVDGGSNDGTRELLGVFEERFRKKKFGFRWISEKDSGQGEAMNKGLKMASGDFAMILNSDDFLYESDAVARYMKVVAGNPAIDAIYGDHESLFEDGKRRVIRHRQYSLEDILMRACQVPQSAAIFRKAFIDRVGGFDESLHHVAEHELFLRMMKSGARFSYFPCILQVTLEHAGRKTGAFGTRAWRETKKVNFRNGASYFSRFYLIYLKNVYFRWFWDVAQKYFPGLYRVIKGVFNRLTKGQ